MDLVNTCQDQPTYDIQSLSMQPFLLMQDITTAKPSIDYISLWKCKYIM